MKYVLPSSLKIQNMRVKLEYPEIKYPNTNTRITCEQTTLFNDWFERRIYYDKLSEKLWLWVIV